MTSTPQPKRNYTQAIRTYLILTFVILGAAGYFGFGQYQKLSAMQDALAKEQETLITLQRNHVKLVKQYDVNKKSFDQKFSNVLNLLQDVYPAQENYTNLARLFDDFFQVNNTVANPIFVSDLKFGIARTDASKDYSVLPVTLTISGTQNNFLKFLNFVENSGVLKNKTRLMDLGSISINFISQSEETNVSSDASLLNVSIALNAYFQKSTVSKPKTST